MREDVEQALACAIGGGTNGVGRRRYERTPAQSTADDPHHRLQFCHRLTCRHPAFHRLPPGLFPGPRRGPSFGPSSKRRDLLPGPLLRGPERVSRSDAPKRPSPRGPPGFPVLRPSKPPLPCSTVRPSASRNSARSRLPGRRSLRPSSRCSRRSGCPSSERFPSGRGRCGRASLSKRPSGRLL